MIRELGESIGNTVVETVGRAVGQAQERRPLPVDLLESDDAYLAIFDAPGAEATDVQVRFEDGTVLVRVDRFREFHEGFEMRFPGRGMALDGSVDLPEGARVDADGATSTLKENGTLQVRVPKLDEESDDEGSEDDEGDEHAAADEDDEHEESQASDEASEGDADEDAES